MQQTMEPQAAHSDPIVPPKDGKVKLTAKGVWDGKTIHWSLDEDEHSPPSGKKAEIVLRKDGGECEVTIKIKMDGPSVFFDRSNPLSVSEISCPSKNSGIDTNQIVFKGVPVHQNGKQLTFTDLNTGPARTLHYALNFVDAEPLDPVIRNGGSAIF